MKNKIRVIIADDHDIYLDGLEKNLIALNEIEVIAKAPNGKMLVEQVAWYLPDVVLTDLRMPEMGGVEAIAAITKMNKNIKNLVLSTFDNNYLVVEALEAGALGYISKDVHKLEVIDAVKTVYDNTPYYCSTTTANMERLIKKSRFNPYPEINKDLFSSFEKKIIRYMCEEKTSEQIGNLLYIGTRSIEKYRSGIQKKMRVKSAAGAAIYAVKNNLYPSLDPLLE